MCAEKINGEFPSNKEEKNPQKKDTKQPERKYKGMFYKYRNQVVKEKVKKEDDRKAGLEKREKEREKVKPEEKVKKAKAVERAEPEKAERYELPSYWHVGGYGGTPGDSDFHFVNAKDENAILPIGKYLPSGYLQEVRGIDRGRNNPANFISRKGDLIIIGNVYPHAPPVANKRGYKAYGTTIGYVVEGVMFREDDYYNLIYELNELDRIDEVFKSPRYSRPFVNPFKRPRHKGEKDWGEHKVLEFSDLNPYQWADSVKRALEKGPFEIPESVPQLEIPFDVGFKDAVERSSMDAVKNVGKGLGRIDRFKARKEKASAKSGLKSFFKDSIPKIEQINEQVIEKYRKYRKTLGEFYDKELVDDLSELEKLLLKIAELAHNLSNNTGVKGFKNEAEKLIWQINIAEKQLDVIYDFALKTESAVDYKLRDKESSGE